MSSQVTLCSLLILMFVNGFVSYDLHHKRQMGVTSEEDPMLQENGDLTKVEENLNSNFFEGDILTTSQQMKQFNRLLLSYQDTTKSGDDRADVRALVKDVRKTWPNGVVYYQISNLIAPHTKRLITKAMEHWKQRTCLNFQRRTNEKDYIQFKKGAGCASYVGRIGGPQSLIAGSHCALGNIIHEIGHAVGFFHEMARPDRNKYVKIIWKNIVPSRRRNFLKYTTKTIDSRDVKYDYDSIMHYSKHHFNKSPTVDTILPTRNKNAHIGQRVGLSVRDVKQARLLYNCGNAMTMETDGDMDGEN